MWLAFDQKEPIGDWRQDLGFGVVASTFANANRKADAKPFSPQDFMPLRPAKKLSLAQKVREALMNMSGKKKDSL